MAVIVTMLLINVSLTCCYANRVLAYQPLTFQDDSNWLEVLD